MDRENPIELSLELGPGDFALRLDGVIMKVRLKAADGLGDTPPRKRQPALDAPPDSLRRVETVPEETVRLSQEASFYRQASQEIYQGLGKLAKNINLSMQDLSLAKIIQNDTASPEERLDQVRSQVTDVLEMTEKATLNILELVEQIREDCLRVQAHLLSLGQPEAASEEPAAATGTSGSGLGDAVLAQGEALSQELHALLEVSPGGAMVPSFSLAAVLQILLEYCGSEAVKPHLKAVLDQQEALFRPSEVETALGHLAAEVPVDDGLHQFPVDKVLKIVQEKCLDDRVRELFGKLLASAAKLFPLPALPLEGQPPENPGASGEPSGVLSRWEDFFQKVRELAAQGATRPGSPPGGTDGAATQEALATVERINYSLSRIMEALSFQDLSGQRLLKVLTILRQLQLQVLALLLAAGNKLKMTAGEQETIFQKSALLVQEELDRMLYGADQGMAVPETGSATSDGGQALDQEAINELLTGMGF